MTSHKYTRLNAILFSVFLCAMMAPHAVAAPLAMTYYGAWVSTTKYQPGYVVTYNGASYICLATNTGITPPTNKTDWGILDLPGALSDANGDTAEGASTLGLQSFGSANTGFGSNALGQNTSGSRNTASGSQALTRNDTGSDNSALGFQALTANTIGVSNTATGVSALFFNFTGTNNTAVGFGADVSIGNLTNATALGAGAVVNASNKIRLGNASVTVIEGQVAYTFTSDVTQKENFLPIDGDEVLRKLGGLRVTSWNYAGQDAAQFRHYGPNAQEFFAAFGRDGVGTIGSPTTINSGDEAGIIMVALQALARRTAEVAELRAETAELKARLEAVERRVVEQPVATARRVP